MPASNGSNTMADAPESTFEAKLTRIEQIVKELENGSVPLEQAVKLFEEGKTLARDCDVLLKGAQENLDKAMDDAT